LDRPVAGVGVEDEEAVEDMDNGGMGIMCAMRETKGIDSGPDGQGGLKKERERE
jgi:hypothetical protein